MGSALGLAILSAMAITRTNDLLAAHTARLDALDAGYHRGLLAGSIFLIAAAVIALRIGNTRAAAPLVLISSATAPEHAASSRVEPGRRARVRGYGRYGP